jgi:environmental stress-induced protein Ves
MQLVATHPPEATAVEFDWRISVAQVVQDSPFSAFPGYDRCIALLSGNGMVLSSRVNGIDENLNHPLQPFHFAGEASIRASLNDGPLSNLSVLARRGVCCIEFNCLHAPINLTLPDLHMPVLIHCVSGEISMEPPNQAPLLIRSTEFVLWRSESPRMRLTSSTDDTRVVLIKLRPTGTHTPSAANASRTAAT